MKKLIFTLFALLSIHFAQAQTTYYWVGGTAAATSFTANSNWNTVKGSTDAATQRTADAPSDILIFDGTDYGGGVTTGTVLAITTTTTCGQLILQNNASVNLQRQTTGSGTITVSGMNGDDLVVNTGSTLTISSTDPAGSAIVSLAASATGTINGTVNITGGGSRLACLNADPGGALFFENGSTANVNVVMASNYPFGGNTGHTAARSIVFKSGSSLVYQGGNSIWGGTSTYHPLDLKTGSTVYFDANAASVSNLFNSRTYANVTVRNNATVTLSDNFYNIDNLTINAGSSFNTRISGTNPIAGNIVNNGTFGASAGYTTAHLIFDGITPQTVSGTGTFNGFGAVSVATGADVTINTNLMIGATGSPTSTISGKLNMQNHTIGGTGAFTLRAAQSVSAIPGTLTAGSNDITLNSSVYSGSVNTANVAIGMLVTGTGIQPNTYIIATSSSSSRFTVSKPPTITTATDGASLTITGFAPTLQTANSNGVDGTIVTTGTKSYGAGANYIFDGATSAPFSTASSAAAGNVTFNAAATLNKSMDLLGTLTMNTGKLTIPPGLGLRILSGNAIAGGPFSSSKYIVTEVNTSTGDQAGLRIDAFTAPTLFPIGSPTNYLPVTLDPLTASDFTLAVFEGITNEGNPQGTPMPAAQKAEVVNAVWTINRNSANSDACDVTLNWVSSLEGATFATFTNAQIGMARHDGTAWGVSGGTGDNTANFVTHTFSSFSPFGVGRKGFVLPLKFTNFNAALTNNKVAVKWNIENEAGIDRYVVERSANGSEFNAIGTVTASNLKSYSHIDATPLNGSNFYRIRSVATDGQLKYTGIVKIATGRTNADITLSPNPVRGNQFIVNMAGFTKGNYSLTLLNAAGQKVYSMNLGQVDGAASNTIQLPAGIQKGMYTVLIHSNELQLQKVIILQ
jgi:hypothetical protein